MLQWKSILVEEDHFSRVTSRNQSGNTCKCFLDCWYCPFVLPVKKKKKYKKLFINPIFINFTDKTKYQEQKKVYNQLFSWFYDFFFLHSIFLFNEMQIILSVCHTLHKCVNGHNFYIFAFYVYCSLHYYRKSLWEKRLKCIHLQTIHYQ